MHWNISHISQRGKSRISQLSCTLIRHIYRSYHNLNTPNSAVQTLKLPTNLLQLPFTLKQSRDLIVYNNIPSGEQITLYGWIRTTRKHKKVAFVNIQDGSNEQLQQLVFHDPEAVNNLRVGMSIKVTGSVQLRNRSDAPYELHVSNFTVLGDVSEDDQFPLQNKYFSQDYLRRELPTVRFRSSSNGVAMRFRSRAIAALSDFFNRHGFVQTHPPLITSSDCEGAGEVFTVKSDTSKTSFFGEKEGYLTVSTQLHLEALMMGLSRVWTLSPAFRAEKSATSRHLSEFWMLEAEVAYADQLEHIMSLVEGMIRTAVSILQADGQLDSALSVKSFLEKQKIEAGEGEDPDREITFNQIVDRWNSLTQPERWLRITYTDAVSILQQEYDTSSATFDRPRYGDSLGSEHEKWLAKMYARGPIFVTQYPASLKPFYMLPTSNGETVECFDLLVPDIGELVGGSLREHDLERLQKAVEKAGIDPSDLQWYIELRKWGSVPHGGFGMGFERLLCYLLGIYNIRDVIAFPRWVNHCVC
ncbi:hypothetical protein V1512DRAFT_267867 [Lipomyces arxii]|uniref:uncharacterized protein n=1 Tax=Lipomyces arxii TaxID=56418 RepID=UPI0034CD5722